MRKDSSLNEVLHETFHRSKKKPQEIADELGVSYNYLARAVLEGPSGCNFPLRLLVPLMKATRNFGVLKKLAHLCGFMVVPLPKGIRKLGDAHSDLRRYQKRFAGLLEELVDFVDCPSQAKYRHLNERLLEHMQETEWWRRRCQANAVNQLELFGEDLRCQK